MAYKRKFSNSMTIPTGSRRLVGSNFKRSKTYRVWSNSVGTRVRPKAWVNPTVGTGASIRSGMERNTPYAKACMEVALNAFSRATKQPRFPDGKVTESIGLHYQMMNEIEAAPGSSGNIDIIFFPGINACMTIRGATTPDLGPPTSPQNAALSKLQRVSNHVTGNVEIVGDQLVFEQVPQLYVAKWRLVSAGCMFSLINNSEENDGWWEACRITPSSDIRDYGFSYSPMANPDDCYGQPINVFHTIPQLTSSEMLNQSSYSTGKLRHINNVLFSLNPEYGDRDFIDLARRTEIELSPGAGANLTPVGMPLHGLIKPDGGLDYVGATFAATASTSPRVNDEVISSLIDTTFDAIYIRIHGVDNSNGRNPSKLTMYTAMNHEIVYDEKAHNAKFHAGHAVYHDKHDQIKGEPYAAQSNLITSSVTGMPVQET